MSCCPFEMALQQDQTSVSFSVLFAISFAFGVVCNALILILVWRRKIFKDECQARLLIGHSSVVDLLSSSSCLQSSIGFLSPNLLTMKKYNCYGLSYFNGVIIPEMHHSYILLAIHRYLIIKEPVISRRTFSEQRTYVYIGCTWFFSFLIVFVAELTNKEVMYLPTVGYCMYVPRKSFGTALVIIRTLIFIITIFFYVKAFLAYRSSQRLVKDMCKFDDSSPQLELAEILEKDATHGRRIQQDECGRGKKQRSNSYSDILIRQLGQPPKSDERCSGKRQWSKSASEGIDYFKGHPSITHEGVNSRSIWQTGQSNSPWVRFYFYMANYLIVSCSS